MLGAMQIAQTDRLILRDFTPDYLDDLCVLFGDPDVMHYGDGPQSNEWTATWLRMQLVRANASDCKRAYAILERSTARFIGYTGLFSFDDIHGHQEIELGYRLVKKEWNRGYGK
jgi:RimJ/RimL family protein N-acetyltransferase